MPTLAQQEAADNAKVEEHRREFGDESAARLDARLYEFRRTPSTSYLAGFPKWAVVLLALWVVALETADKLPQLLLSYPRYEAALAEIQVKLMQPAVVSAQLATAVNEAKASEFKPATAQAQLDKALSDARTARFTAEAAPLQPAQAAINLQKTTLDVRAAVFQPKLNEIQLVKLGVETKTAAFQQGLTASQAIQAEQGTAMTNAALAVTMPLIADLLKQYGINVPMDKIAPALSIINPAARTADLQSAVTTGATTTSAAPVTSQEYQNGVQARTTWENYVASLSGDASEGAQFWASVRSDKKQHTCNEQKGATSQAFRDACNKARQMLISVDRNRKANADYLAGWNSL
jgi:hypothetical protein